MTLLRVTGMKLLYLIPVVILVTMLMTALLDLLPGDPALAILGSGASAEAVTRINETYGFDRPFFERYISWMLSALTGDFGTSLATGQPVSAIIMTRLPVTLQLALMSLTISIILSIVLAVLAAYRENSFFDRMMTTLASASMSIPSFVAAVLLVYVFAILMGWFPVFGYRPLRSGLGEHLEFLVLPVATIAILETGFFYRILRGDLGSTLREDFITTARSKGLGTSNVLWRHALRPSLFSMLTMIGLSFGRLLGGAVIIETFYGIPGIGQLLVNSVNTLDIPVIQATVALIAVFYVLINALVDLLYSVIDPRVKVGG